MPDQEPTSQPPPPGGSNTSTPETSASPSSPPATTQLGEGSTDDVKPERGTRSFDPSKVSDAPAGPSTGGRGVR
jgi:hypothetical protein